jgi:hypothetical protein
MRFVERMLILAVVPSKIAGRRSFGTCISVVPT